MASYPGVYRAKAVRLEGDKLIAFVPQVFGDTSVTILDFIGDTPTTLDMGWVAFHGGHAEYPVWVGTGVSITGTEGPTTFGAENVWLWQGGDSSAPVGDGGLATDSIPSESSQLYVYKCDSADIDRSYQLSRLVVGDHIYLQYAPDADSWHLYRVTGAPYQVDGDTWVIPVTTEDGSAPGTAPDTGSPVLVNLIIGSDTLATVYYRYSSNTSPPTTPPPNDGVIRFNSSDLTAATVMWMAYVSERNTDVHVALGNELAERDTIYIQDQSDANVFQSYDIAGPLVFDDANKYITFPVSWTQGSAVSFSNNTPVGILFSRPGGGGGAGSGLTLDDLSFVHHQAVSAATWTITHNLGWYPNVTVIDSAGDTVDGNTSHPSANQVVLTFSAAFSGTAYLS